MNFLLVMEPLQFHINENDYSSSMISITVSVLETNNLGFDQFNNNLKNAICPNVNCQAWIMLLGCLIRYISCDVHTCHEPSRVGG